MTSSTTFSTYTMSPYERTSVGSYVPTPYFVNSSGIYNFTLSDYISTGQIVKIEISETGDLLWLTNNQKISKYDGVARGGKLCSQISFAEQDPYCPEGKGLFVWREGSGCSNFNLPFDIISAEGKYDWSVFRWVYVPVQNNYYVFGQDLPVFKYTASNIIYGRDTYEKYPAYPANNYSQYISYDECNTDSSEFYFSFDIYGNTRTAFNLDYNEILSPYSNPSSNTCRNQHSTLLTIRLLSQNAATGEMQLRVYYNKNDSALIECSPAKPKTPVITKQYVIPRISYHPVVNWEANTEPDFTGYGNYKIYRGISFNCGEEPVFSQLNAVSSNINIFNDSGLILYDNPQGSVGATNRKVFLLYKIMAVDKYNMESVISESGEIYGYNDSITSYIGKNEIIPNLFELYQNEPNPFNPTTRIKYDILLRSL